MCNVLDLKHNNSIFILVQKNYNSKYNLYAFRIQYMTSVGSLGPLYNKGNMVSGTYPCIKGSQLINP